MDEPTGRQGFDYAAYFQRIRDLERLGAAPDEVTWRERHQPPDRPVDALLYLGCNVLITSHLAIEVVAVLKRLGVDFEAVGGPQYCCGIVHHTQGGAPAASRLSAATVNKFESFKANTLIMWCPSCDMHVDEIVLPTIAPGFQPEITHATQFLADRAASLPFEREVPTRVAVHAHVGTPRQERDAAAGVSLLQAVPGVEVVGTVASAELGYHCPTPTSPEAQRSFVAQRRRLLDEAAAMGADTVATLYHSCHREWCGEHADTLAVRNYISIVAEALGCAAEDRYRRLRQSTSIDEVVAASEPEWTAQGWDEARARRAAASFFPDLGAEQLTTNG